MSIVPDKFYCLHADWFHLSSLNERTFEQTVGIFAITFIWECLSLCTPKSNFGLRRFATTALAACLLKLSSVYLCERSFTLQNGCFNKRCFKYMQIYTPPLAFVLVYQSLDKLNFSCKKGRKQRFQIAQWCKVSLHLPLHPCYYYVFFFSMTAANRH